jgi:acidic leucine-rich nuclear phosphoprotein 32 family protein A/C/D
MEILRKTALLKLEQQTKGVDPLTVTELSFGDVPLVPVLLLQPFTNLTRLALVSCRPALVNIFDIPFRFFPNLRTLDVSDNRIREIAPSQPDTSPAAGSSPSSSQSAVVLVCSAMRRLTLANNQLQTFASLQSLALIMPDLEVLDLEPNPLTGASGGGGDGSYRAKCFEMFLSLQAVDSMSKSGEEVEVPDSDEDSSDEDDDEEGEAEEESDEEEEAEEEGSNADGEPAEKKLRSE